MAKRKTTAAGKKPTARQQAGAPAFRDRIKELRRVPAGEIAKTPRNWRTHSREQKSALLEVLEEIGIADAMIARELPDGSLELIDGELRLDTMPHQLVPVLVLDVTEEEANKLLLTLDPLAGMAGTNAQRLDELLRQVDTSGEAIGAMLAKLTKDAGLYQVDGQPTAAGDGEHVEFDAEAADEAAEEVELKEGYEVVVVCEGEAQQQEIYERLTKEGLTCKVLTY